MKGQGGIPEAKRLENPLRVMFEITNLMNLYREKLEALSPMADVLSPSGNSWNSWDVRSKVPGYYSECPLHRWTGKEVFVEGVGQGRIVAACQVGNWYIPGVEFKEEVRDGHALNLRTHGREGQEGHCLWVWLDKVKLVRDTKLPPNYTPTGGLG